MRTNLAYVDEAATAAVEEFANTPVLKRVGGFLVKEGTKSESGDVKHYKSSRDQLVSNLEAGGVTPLAVLPTSWWRKMLSESELVDAGNNGAVRPRDSAKGWVDNLALGMGIVLSAIPYLAILAGVYLNTIAGMDAPSVIAYFIVGGMVTFLFGACTFLWMTATAGSFFIRLASWLFVHTRSRTTLLKKHMEFVSSSWNGLSFNFGEAPEEISDVLLKVRHHDLRVAAEARAFLFKDSVTDFLANSVSEDVRVRREKRALSRLMADPIVYVTNGPATAIICQYGEYQFEKEMIDRVVGQGL